MLLAAFLGGCDGGEPPRAGPAVDTVLVVLGNEPLDDATPTLDMIARVDKAAAFHKEQPDTVLLFTGGSTAGLNTEARMMAALARERGVPDAAIRLEERARSTEENARFSASLIRPLRPRRILIVSKADHLEWAMPIFQAVDLFKDAQPLACEVGRAELMAQMERYLQTHDNPRVRHRLELLKAGVRGVD